MNLKVVFAIALLCMAVQAPVSAGSLNPLNLIGAVGGTITDGDKAFSNFTCAIGTTTGIANPVDCGQISVQAFTDVFGNFGIQFTGSFNAAVTNLTFNSSVDVALGYTVTDLSGQTMTDAHLGFDAKTVGVVGTPFLLANVTETINEISPTPTLNLAVLNVSAPPPMLNDAVTFAGPITSAQVVKDVTLLASGNASNTGVVIFSTINQNWSESNVPEPGSIVLFGSALVGCVAVLRRRLSH